MCAILPGRDALRELSRKHPGKRWRPLPLRLVKYTRGATEYVVGTTLLDSRRYRVAALADLYHARWGIEELYKVSKQFLEVDQFHGRSERLVKQELFAHFNLIAMTRLLANRDAALCEAALPQDGRAVPQANFKHSLAGAGTAPRGPAAAPFRVCQRDPRADLRVGRDRSAQAAPRPLVPAALAAAGLEMGPSLSESNLAGPMPTRKESEMDVI